MKAWQVEERGAPPVLRRLQTPAPGPGEARVAVEAAALNFGDLLMIEGTYQDRPPLPFTFGMEIAGTVDALGPGTDGPAPGTRVAAYVGHGGLAGHAIARAADCLPIPDALPIRQAAAVPVAYGTADLALFHRARLAPGEWLVVSGAAGGVGLTAVELGAAAGARVVALARGAKVEAARAAGAEIGIDTARTDPPGLRDALREATSGGAHVLYDTVGGATFEQALRALGPGGRAVVVGFASGDVPGVRLNHLLVKNVDVIGYWWGDYARFDPDTLRASLARCLAAAGAGTLRPHVGLRLPLAQVPEGLAALKARRTTGKVVVEIAPEDR